MNSFFEQHKALIITSLLMGIFVLSLHNIALSRKGKEAQELLLELNAAEYLEEESKELIPQEIKPDDPQIASIDRTHKAFNEENQSDQDDFEQKLAALNEKMNSLSEISDSADSPDGTETIAAKNLDTNKPNKSGDDKPKKEVTESALTESSNHGSSIRYSLLSRNAIKLPNPVYTCGNKGKIVVNVVVNSFGHVASTEINSAASSSANGCLIDSALSYAKRAQFNATSKESQLGTITYYFNY